jgi:hypothetical protein
MQNVECGIKNPCLRQAGEICNPKSTFKESLSPFLATELEKNFMERALEKLAEQILSFDEASLANLREKYRLRIEQFDGTKDWEKAVIIYCIINAVSMKNTLFNENVLKRMKNKEGKSFRQRRGYPDLKRVK